MIAKKPDKKLISITNLSRVVSRGHPVIQDTVNVGETYAKRQVGNLRNVTTVDVEGVTVVIVEGAQLTNDVVEERLRKSDEGGGCHDSGQHWLLVGGVSERESVKFKPVWCT